MHKIPKKKHYLITNKWHKTIETIITLTIPNNIIKLMMKYKNNIKS